MSLPAQIPRIPWTPEEDAALTRAVEQHGDKRWSQISAYLPGRTSKACSHRWRTYLQPGVMHASSVPFNAWEKAVVKEAHRQIGNNWALIARMLPGRTNAAVKNFWYQLRRRSGRAQGRQQQPGAGTDADGAWDSDGEGEDVSSADEMDCEDDCEVGDMMAGPDYGADPMHAMEVVDCSASWQQVAGSDAAAAAGWVQIKQEHLEGATEELMVQAHPGSAAQTADQFTPGPNRWPFAAVTPGIEMHGSSGGAGSNAQPPLDQFCQQQMLQQAAQQPQQLQQQDMRSCAPRRSSHHSWSGAPRSFPGGAGAGSGPDLFGRFEAPPGPELWSNLPQQLQGVPGSAAGAAGAAAADGLLPPMVGRVSQPRLSGHGFLDPQHLGGRASCRFTSSNQLFEVQTATPLPFGELHSRQVITTAAAAPAGTAPVKAEPQGTQARLEKPYRFALDLSAIDESEPDAHATAAAAYGTVRQGQLHSAGCDRSSLGCDRMAGSSSGKSTDMQQDWPAGGEQQQGFMDGAVLHVRQEQQQDEQQQQQGRKRALEQQQHLMHAEQQGAAHGGHMFPPRKLVRPSLCSDAGTAPQQQLQAAATADAGAKAAPGSNSGARSTGSRRFVLDLSDDAL